jgi:hypothetical protein
MYILDKEQHHVANHAMQPIKHVTVQELDPHKTVLGAQLQQH